MTLSLRTLAARLAGLELPAVAISIMAAVAVERLAPIALMIAAAFWLVRWPAARRLTLRTPGDWAMVLLLLMIPVTLWATALPEVTRSQVFTLLMGVALYYAMVNWAHSAGRLDALVAGLVAVGLALAALTPFLGATPAVGQFLPTTLSHLFQRFTDIVNPNIVAGALALLAPLACALPLFAAGRGWLRLLAALATLAMLGVVALSQSRGAWIALVCAGLLLLALRWRWGWLALPLAAASGAFVLWRLGPQQLAELVTTGGPLGGADQRLEIWSRALYMIQDFPFTGVGMGGFQQVANLLYPFFLAGPDAVIGHAHNLFLQVAVDLGLPGLIAWLALFWLASVAAWQAYRRGRALHNARLAALGAGLLASQVTLAFHGLTDAATWGTRPAVIVWALWGAAAAAYQVADLAARPTGSIISPKS